MWMWLFKGEITEGRVGAVESDDLWFYVCAQLVLDYLLDILRWKVIEKGFSLVLDYRYNSPAIITDRGIKFLRE